MPLAGQLSCSSHLARYRDRIAVTDPYVDDALSHILDVGDTNGVAYYTFYFVSTIDVAMLRESGPCSPVNLTIAGPAARIVFFAAQLSYRATLWADGGNASLPPVGAAPGATDAVGMYRRFDWDLGLAATWCGQQSHGISLLVRPPDYPGVANGGQGGDKTIAKNVISQDTAGWDFAPAAPDRNTGLFDDVTIVLAPGGVLLRDGAVSVTDLNAPGPGAPTNAKSLVASVRVSAVNLGRSPVSGLLRVSIPGAGLAAQAAVSLPADGAWHEFDAAPASPLEDVPLWWPHMVGRPTLLDASAMISIEGPAAANVSLSWRAGFRTIAMPVNATLGGRQVVVNGQRVFLQAGREGRAQCLLINNIHPSNSRARTQGGNFVSTDVLHRAQFRGRARARAEVRLHAEMGLQVGAETSGGQTIRRCLMASLRMHAGYATLGRARRRACCPLGRGR